MENSVLDIFCSLRLSYIRVEVSSRICVSKALESFQEKYRGL